MMCRHNHTAVKFLPGLQFLRLESVLGLKIQFTAGLGNPSLDRALERLGVE